MLPLKERFSSILPLAGIITLALLIRTALTYEHHGHALFSFYRIDEVHYNEWAKVVMNGQFFLDYVPNHAPGYPWLLGIGYRILGEHPLVPRILQIGLGIGSTILVHRIATRLVGAGAALAGALIFSLYWPFLIFEQRILATTFFVFLSLASLLAATRATRNDSTPAWALVGILTGAAAIVRPTALLWLSGALGWLLVSAAVSRKLSLLLKALSLAAAASLVIVPVVLKNHEIEGRRFLIQRMAALNLYLGNNLDSDGTPYARLGETWDAIESLPTKEQGITDEAERETFYLKKVIEFAEQDPGPFFVLQLKKLALLLNGREIRATIDPEFQRSLFRTLSIPLPGFGLALGLAFAGLPLLRRCRRDHQVLLIYLMTHAAAILSAPVSSRYRAPFTAAVIVLSGAGFVKIVDSLRRAFRERGSLWDALQQRTHVPVLLCLLGLLIAALPVAPEYSDAEEWTYLGDAWLSRGNHGRALGFYREALRQEPEYAIALARMGNLERLAGRLDSSIQLLERAVASEPNNSWVRYELAITLWEAEKKDEAIEQMSLAVESRPLWIPALRRLAEYEWETGAKQRARGHVRAILALRPNFEDAKRMLAEMAPQDAFEFYRPPPPR